MDPKLLTEDGWKTTADKNGIKDKDLGKALLLYEMLEDDDYEFRLKGLAKISTLAANLKRDKEISSKAPAAKYLADMAAAAEAQKRELARLKAEAEKAAALAAKKAQANAKQPEEPEEEEEEEQGGDYTAKLLATLQKLKSAKDAAYEFAVCTREEDPRFAVVVAKKITPAHKKMLMEAGGKKFLNLGNQALCTCRFEDGKLTFAPEKPITGLARKLQDSIKYFTGKKYSVVIGSESVGEEDEPLLNMINPELREQRGGQNPDQPAPVSGPLGLAGSVGRGGKNQPEDVKAVQEALNKRINAGLSVNGKCDASTLKAIMEFQKALGQFNPDGLVEPRRGTARMLAASGKLPPPPEPPKPLEPPKLGKASLAQAPKVWHSTRGLLSTNINELKKGVRAFYGTEHPDLLKQIEENMLKLGVVLDKLDDRLATTLEKAQAAANDAARKAELARAKAILADYIKYVKSEPLIDHMDSNPFGVKTSLKRVLTDSLTHMAQAIG